MPPFVDGLALVALLAACHGAGFLGGRWTRRNLDWYAGLRKPAWTPPGVLIRAVWLILFTLMAVSAWLVWREAGWTRGAALPLGLFAVQLVLNAAWSLLFFARRDPGAAFADVVLLGAAIAATAWSFASFSLPAALLLLPYLAWVAFAAALNLALWRMNAGRLAARGPRPIPR